MTWVFNMQYLKRERERERERDRETERDRDRDILMVSPLELVLNLQYSIPRNWTRTQRGLEESKVDHCRTSPWRLVVHGVDLIHCAGVLI